MDSGKKGLFLLTANSEGSVLRVWKQGSGRRSTGGTLEGPDWGPWFHSVLLPQRSPELPSVTNFAQSPGVFSETAASALIPMNSEHRVPKWYVLIISDLQDKLLRRFSLFRCRWRTHRSAEAKTLYNIAEVVRVLSNLVRSARII